MQCKNCGWKNTDDAESCVKCHTPFKKGVVQGRSRTLLSPFIDNPLSGNSTGGVQSGGKSRKGTVLNSLADNYIPPGPVIFPKPKEEHQPSMSYTAAEPCDFAPGESIDSRWRVDALLGEGTFGRVFRVQDISGNTFALKLMKLWEVAAKDRPNLIKRFDREYETGRIRSDYLVHTLQKGMVRGNPYIVMEYCSGGDMCNARESARGNLPLLASHILSGLQDLHNNGKVHRDLKPENVLLRTPSHAVLTDFGISGDQNNRLTQRGINGIPTQVFGTIAYMPPEQLNPRRGNATVLPTTDIFSFGVMIYELLTGSLPFGPLDSSAMMSVYTHRCATGQWDRQRLMAVSGGAQWMPLIEGCLHPDFQRRLQTIPDVMRLLPGGKVQGRSAAFANTAPINRDSSRGLMLRVMQGEEPGRTYNLSTLFTDNCNTLYIGRGIPAVWNHIPLCEQESCYISRCHCTIERDPATGRWTIRDGQLRPPCPMALRLPSTRPCNHCTAHHCSPASQSPRWKESLNGTYVNSVEATRQGIPIAPGDIISIGDVKMRVEGV